MSNNNKSIKNSISIPYLKNNIIAICLCVLLSLSAVAGYIFMPENSITANAEDLAANQAEVYSYLRNVMGLNEAAACGVMANIKNESNFRTGAIGDGGQSLGLCQWYSGRKAELLQYCANNNLDVYSVYAQMSFFNYEISNKSLYATTRNKLRSTSNDVQGAYDAAYTMCVNYEVPANTRVVAVSRGRDAQWMFMPQYGTVNSVVVNTDYENYIANTSAMLGGSISKPANVTVSEVGIYLGRDANDLQKREIGGLNLSALNASNNGYGFGLRTYTGKSPNTDPSLNLILQPGTEYFYQYYFVADGVEYKGVVKSFKTSGTLKFDKDEYLVDFDYIGWNNITKVQGQSYAVHALTLRPINDSPTGNEIYTWNSSDTAVAEVVNGMVVVHKAGKVNITVSDGTQTATACVEIGKITTPQVTMKSLAQGISQSSFACGDTVEFFYDKQSAAGCHRLRCYRVDGNSEVLVYEHYLSSINADQSWKVEEKCSFLPDRAGKYKYAFFMSNDGYVNESTGYFEVLEKEAVPVDTNISDYTANPENGIGSLAGVSMALDGYIVMNYYIAPTSLSADSDMRMEFTVGDKVQTDYDYDVIVIGDMVTYRYECRLEATELTENIAARLVLGDKTGVVRTITANDYCKNLLNDNSGNAVYDNAKPVVRALVNYCGYAQKYFGKNTDKLANAGLYANAADDPVNGELAGEIAGSIIDECYASINGNVISAKEWSKSPISMNGITYLGTSLKLDSGISVKMYFMLEEGKDGASLDGYTFGVDEFGSIVIGVDEKVVMAEAEAVSAGEGEISTDAEDISTEAEAVSAGAEDISTEAEAAELEGVIEASAVETSEEACESSDVEESGDTEESGDAEESGDIEESGDTEESGDAAEAEETESTVEAETAEEAEEAEIEPVVSEEFVYEYTAMANEANSKLEYSIQGNILCITLKDLSMDQIDEVYTYRICSDIQSGSQMVLRYSVMKYVSDANEQGSNKLVDLVKAMYIYHRAVSEYKK